MSDNPLGLIAFLGVLYSVSTIAFLIGSGYYKDILR
jgi:hypothetical protein